MKSVILALLPGLEDETSEDFDRTLKILEKFKVVIRPPNCRDLTSTDSTGDDFFWQCFFLATITGQSRRPGALAYLIRRLPRLGHPVTQEVNPNKAQETEADVLSSELSNLVTSPEPGLLLRCFAAGLGDEQLLIQRGFLDLLVTHLPLHSKVLQKRVKSDDLELLLRAAACVVIRRDMSLKPATLGLVFRTRTFRPRTREWPEVTHFPVRPAWVSWFQNELFRGVRIASSNSSIIINDQYRL